MNKQKRLLFGSLGLTALYLLWLAGSWWNLGFSIINTLWLYLAAISYPKIFRKKFPLFLAGVSLVLGWFFSLRSYGVVRFFSLVTIMVANGLAVALAQRGEVKLDLGRITRTYFGIFPGIARAWRNFIKLVSVGEKVRNFSRPRIKVIKGVIWSIPLLLVFGGLFYSADPLFASLVKKIKLPMIEWNTILIGDLAEAWLFFGVILAALRLKLADRKKITKSFDNITETNIAVMILEALFLVFVGLQIRYWGAGVEDLKNLGINFSEYTRTGYGQMILASILAYGILMRLEYSIRSQRKTSKSELKLTKIISLVMMAEILIIILSATKRNFLYQQAYGFTRVRLLGYFLSAWLAAMIGLVAAQIYKNKGKSFFSRGLVAISCVAVVAVNFFNIDRMIAKSQPARLDWGIDYNYMVGLSNDAWEGWPKMLEYLEETVERVEEEYSFDNEFRIRGILRKMKFKYDQLNKEREKEWQRGGSWNLADYRAWKFLDENKERFGQIEDRLDKATKNIEVEGTGG